MMLDHNERKLCCLFAGVLGYPDSSLPGKAADLAREAERLFPEASGGLHTFSASVGKREPGALEELFTQTFDVTPATTLYFGYHLFGETPKRSAFLVKLQEAYDAASFSSDGELADHLGVMLRFLATAQDADFCRPLVEECLLPALARVENELKKDDSPYATVIGSLKVFMQHLVREAARTGGTSRA